MGMRGFNLVVLVLCLILSGSAFLLIDFATSQGILFFAALSVAYLIAAITFIQTGRVESRIDALEAKLDNLDRKLYEAS
jgi:low affinity Fe/Cu permease